LLAILQKHIGLASFDQDVFVNAVGGVKATETAGDLAICMALISSIRNKPLSSSLACFGEIGLTGEIRPVQRSDDRIKEAAKLGFKRLIIPQRNIPKNKTYSDIEVVGVKNLKDAFQALRDWES